MNLIPLHDRIIVKREEAEKQSAGGIIIPDVAGDKPDQGTVMAVGPGKRSEKGEQLALTTKVGETVLFGKFAGQTVKVQGQDYLVMREEDVFAIINKGEAQ